MIKLISFYLAALAASLVLTPLCRFAAKRLGFVAKPKEDRWHKQPTALFGGVAIALTTLALGATTGFLVYNLHPASIFLGDTGSLFLGLNLAALTLVANQKGTGTSGVLSVVAGPVLLLLIPIFDTTLVTIMRLVSGRRPSQG